MGNEHLEPSRGFSWLLLKVRRHMNLETLCQRRHLLAGREEMQCSPPVSRVQCEPGSAALLPRVPRRRRRVLPAASALLPRAVHPPLADSVEAPRCGGLRRWAGFRAGRPGSALPPPWPMGRIVSEGRVSGAAAALAGGLIRNGDSGERAFTDALDARPRL